MLCLKMGLSFAGQIVILRQDASLSRVAYFFHRHSRSYTGTAGWALQTNVRSFSMTP